MKEKEMTFELIELKEEATDYAVVSSQEFSDKYLSLAIAIKNLSEAKKAVDEKLKEIMKEKYYESGTQTIETDSCKITYVPDSIKETFNSTQFKKDYPELYKKYVKTSNVSSSIKLTPKKKEEE